MSPIGAIHFGRECSHVRIRTAVEVGALIRDQRTKLGIDQKELAQKVGVSRKWIVAVEKGKPRAAVGLVLRTLAALGIELTSNAETYRKTRIQHAAFPINIDSIVASARKKRSK